MMIAKKILTSLILVVFAICAMAQDVKPTYDIQRAKAPVVIDGDIFTKEWKNVPWTSKFVDIQGKNRTVKPKFLTKAKMMWDDDYLYIAAVMEEPHLWATITKRDEVMYWDNDFEVFIDVAKSENDYYEFEFNAFNTQWDLMMTKPYKKGGTFNTQWNADGLKTAVKVYGTLNDASDKDKQWTIEIAIPMEELTKNQPIQPKVKVGDTWWMNFSRVQWLKYEIVDGKYKKIKGTEGSKNAENWVWAPTGVIDIHLPLKWGVVTFVD